MFAVIGIIAVTIVLGYFFLAAAFMALCCFGGFDEVNIPAGFAFAAGACVPAGIWVLWVLPHIHLSIA